MSRLSDLLRQVSAADPQLAADLEAEYKAQRRGRSFGLVFEAHLPESVTMPGRPVRRGDKVRILPERRSKERGPTDLWRVRRVQRVDGARVAHLVEMGQPADGGQPRICSVLADDLVVVAEHLDVIYPGLVETGRVERGGDTPFHTIVNSENLHALEMLTYTHRGQIDVIYIDPPYNTRDKDWKYNNDYVDGDDQYRHSKWLAFMERRLEVARELLNPADSVLIVTIDEKENARLSLLLEQMFPEARITMVTSSINSAGATRAGTFARSAEYLHIVQFGTSRPAALPLGEEWNPVKTDNKSNIYWSRLIRSGQDSAREDSQNQFYPVFIRQTDDGPVFAGIGEAALGLNREDVPVPEACVAVWPIRKDLSEGRWRVSATTLRALLADGYVRLGDWRDEKTTVYYLKRGEAEKVRTGVFAVLGHAVDGSVLTDATGYEAKFVPTDLWRITSHDAGNSGTRLVQNLLPDRAFTFPKSLYAVEDVLRFFVTHKPQARVLDFFAGSGTTAHAVMRLNARDGGRRQAILVTNNEVSHVDQVALHAAGLRPGDPDWEARGICEYVTKPRIQAAVTGVASNGKPADGEYRFNQAGLIRDGLAANAVYFTLTYESPLAVGHHRAFARIAPMLWLRAGSRGRVITDLGHQGWDVAEAYGVIANLDDTAGFLQAVAQGADVHVAFVVADEEHTFQMICRDLPPHITAVRLYSSYLDNFVVNTGRSL